MRRLTPRVLVPVFIAAALVSVLIPLGSYVLNFRSMPLSNNPQSWSAFGSYIGGTVGPLISLITLASVLFISTILYEIQQEEKRNYDSVEQKKRNTYDLHREFNSETMFVARTMGGKFVLENQGKNLRQLDEDGKPEETARVWLVLAFYQRLWFAIESDEVEIRLIPKLFGDIFYWWYIKCCVPQLSPTGWESWTHIQELWKKLSKEAPPLEQKEWADRWGPVPSLPPKGPVGSKPP